MNEDPLIISLRKPANTHKPVNVAKPSATSSPLRMPRPAERPLTEMPQRAEHPASVQRVQKRNANLAALKNLPGFVKIIIACVVLAIIAGSLATFISNQTPADPSHVTQADVDNLVARVGALILLPQDETPTIATVTDLNALSGQAFFAHASIGDKVLMYPKAQRAILYSPTQNKVITDGPIVVDKK